MDRYMFLLACQLRMMNLFYHNSHHLTSGISFEGDHEMFSDFYNELNGDYDDVIERSIGMDINSPSDLCEQIKVIYSKLEALPKASSSGERFKIGLSLEEDLIKISNLICKQPVSAGLEQLVGDIGNKAEARVYKIKQRLK